MKPAPDFAAHRQTLLDNLDSDRLEIDLIHFAGPYFEDTDNRLMNLHLVRSWCCRAVMFDEIRRRLPDLRATAEPDYLQSNFINGIKRLPCAW